MPLLTSFTRGLVHTVRRRRRDRDIDDELAFHLSARSADLMARGVPREEALRRARLEFGSRDRFIEECREARSFTLIEDVTRDLRHAFRSLRRSPGLVFVSVLSLALGIGANTTLFSAISAIFFAQPTAADRARLVWIDPGNSNQWSYLNYRDLRESGIFETVFGYRPAALTLRVGESRETVNALAVTGNFFDGLGVGAQAGRVFTSREIDSGPESRAVVLSNRFWIRRFNRDPALIGQTLILNGEAYLVAGVMSADYQPVTLLADPDAYVPIDDFVLSNLHVRANENALNVLGRLKPGLERVQAQGAVTTLGRELERQYPVENLGMGQPARLAPVGRFEVGSAPLAAKIFPPILGMLSGLVLLIACANVAGLLLARAVGRQRELAVRAALGASRQRLIRTLLTESFVLASVGAAAGLLLTVWLMPLFRDLAVPIFGRVHLPVHVNGLLLGYALALVLVTTVVCGAAPALKTTRRDLNRRLQQGGAHGATARLRLRHAMVVIEVAASVVLLVTSLLFVRTLFRIAQIGTGIDSAHGILATVNLPPPVYASRDQLLLTIDNVIDRLDATPGILSSTTAEIVPLAGDRSAARFAVENGTEAGPRSLVNSVGPRYFETLGIPLIRGRDFVRADRAGAAPVAIVSLAFARAYFPNEDALGKRLRRGSGAYSEIVGIVADINYSFVGEEPQPMVYFAHAQQPVSSQQRPVRFHVRTAASPIALLRAVNQVTSELHPGASVTVSTLTEAMSMERDLRRVGSWLLGVLGAIGLLLASLGLYGIVSYIVASRVTEFGVRMALGATAAIVRREVLRRGIALTLAGLLIGDALSLGLARVLAALLAGLSPADPVAFGASAIILLSVGVAASYLPARRAVRVDPAIALRAE